MSVIEHSEMFKSKSGRHFWKSRNENAEKEEKNRKRHNKRHTVFLKNRILQSTPGKESKDTKKKDILMLEPQKGIHDRQRAFREKFKLYLDKKENQKQIKANQKPFVSAVASGCFVEQVTDRKKSVKNTRLLSPSQMPTPTRKIANRQNHEPKQQMNIKLKRSTKVLKTTQKTQTSNPEIFTSTVIKPKSSFSAVVPTKANKIFNESISPVEIHEYHHETPNNYVSPYVTISRGGGRSNREEKQALESRQRKEAAAYFRLQVQRETNRLDSLVDHWRQYADEHELVNVAIGQTTLLTTSKFKQFKRLIEQCENNEGENLVKPEDLEGFWSMVYLQVENCIQRFDRLKILRNSGWEDPDLNTMKEKTIRKINSKTTSRKRVKSSLSEMLKEARKKLKNPVRSPLVQCQTPRSNNTWIVETRGILKTPGSVRTKRMTLTFKKSPIVVD